MEQSTPVSSTHEEGVFSTRDLVLAAVLMTLRFPLTGIDFQIEGTKNHPIGYFKFDDTKAIRDAKMRFMQSSLSVEPKLLMSNMEALKAEISQMRNSPHSKWS